MRPSRLQDVARSFGREVASGRYPGLRFDADERWFERIFHDGRIDVWLITWVQSQGTELHDHGGSSGAFTVVSGELTESLVTGPAGNSRITDRVRRAGAGAGFGPDYVHDVRNVSAAPAVSVHAYSPPLQSMSYYDLSGGRLTRIATVATDTPEHGAEASRSRSGAAS